MPKTMIQMLLESMEALMMTKRKKGMATSKNNYKLISVRSSYAQRMVLLFVNVYNLQLSYTTATAQKLMQYLPMTNTSFIMLHKTQLCNRKYHVKRLKLTKSMYQCSNRSSLPIQIMSQSMNSNTMIQKVLSIS